MIKALQSSSQGMRVQQQRHELIANNLANASTPGFRKLFGRVSATGGPEGTAPGASAKATTLHVESLPALSQGALTSTGNPLDVAILGEGYFQVETPAGPRLSRDGAFGLGPDGQLLHSSGHPVLADGGSVFIQGTATILPDGTVLDGETAVARLSLVTPLPGGELRREGDNLLAAPGGTETVAEGDARLVAGHLEGSNVEAVEEMVAMIRAFRAYEMAAKAAQSADETLRTATSRVGVLRA